MNASETPACPRCGTAYNEIGSFLPVCRNCGQALESPLGCISFLLAIIALPTILTVNFLFPEIIHFQILNSLTWVILLNVCLTVPGIIGIIYVVRKLVRASRTMATKASRSWQTGRPVGNAIETIKQVFGALGMQMSVLDAEDITTLTSSDTEVNKETSRGQTGKATIELSNDQKDSRINVQLESESADNAGKRKKQISNFKLLLDLLGSIFHARCHDWLDDDYEIDKDGMLVGARSVRGKVWLECIDTPRGINSDQFRSAIPEELRASSAPQSDTLIIIAWQKQKVGEYVYQTGATERPGEAIRIVGEVRVVRRGRETPLASATFLGSDPPKSSISSSNYGSPPDNEKIIRYIERLPYETMRCPACSKAVFVEARSCRHCASKIPETAAQEHKKVREAEIAKIKNQRALAETVDVLKKESSEQNELFVAFAKQYKKKIKRCPHCHSYVFLQTRECFYCSYEFLEKDNVDVTKRVLRDYQKGKLALGFNKLAAIVILLLTVPSSLWLGAQWIYGELQDKGLVAEILPGLSESMSISLACVIPLASILIGCLLFFIVGRFSATETPGKT